ncbi:MAG: lysylphosphatidylglycerol synthase transmembrane domain-containing protein [Luteibaculaceae bacterium]
MADKATNTPGILKKIFNFLKVFLPIALGIWLLVHFYEQLTTEEKENMFTSIKKANWFWLILASAVGIFSHWLRAIRWKLLLQPMGYSPKNLNSFFAVLIGYAANLLLPRLGEATRCAMLTKYEDVPFNKSFGTVLAERLIDVILLGIIIVVAVLLQLQLIANSPEATKVVEALRDKLSNTSILYVIPAGLLTLLLVYWVYTRIKYLPFVKKIKTFLAGFAQGFTSLLSMEKKGLFILQSLGIWICYIAMFWICFFAVDATANVPIQGVLLAFVFGSFAVIIVQGGIGIFPVAIAQALLYYSISTPDALALGWIAWLVQTIGYLFFGLLSLILMPIYNKYLHAKLA